MCPKFRKSRDFSWVCPGFIVFSGNVIYETVLEFFCNGILRPTGRGVWRVVHPNPFPCMRPCKILGYNKISMLITAQILGWVMRLQREGKGRSGKWKFEKYLADNIL